ncbi:MAG: NADH-quinone oxidoreductase subunit L [Pirellulales bacterium]
MFKIETLLVLIPALPLVACLVTAALGPKLLREQSHWPTILGLIGSAVLSLLLVREVQFEARDSGPGSASQSVGFEQVYTLWTWAEIPDAEPRPAAAKMLPGAPADTPNVAPQVPFSIEVTLRADTLTSLMLAMVTFISSLVAIYASGYMHGDRGYWRFFTYVSLFVFSMTMLVSVSNFLLLYVFWEAVGACSYLLVGFWYEKPSAAAAGKKAFLVNRVGDFGFALGLFLIWTTYGTLNFHDAGGVAGVLGQTRLADPSLYVGGGVGLAICLLLMVGACGKSAQFPLHVWLPDAMEGPTPVSALIHAATMVTAGVYMVTRCTPLFFAAPEAQAVVAAIGAFTAVMAGFIAITQTDLKRVLAYSTVSQLGYMFLSLGTGSLAGIIAGMFHLFTHAFFKALLFLGAGSVMHAMGGVVDMRRFSGLRKLMPATFLTFVSGSLALSGVFPFAGFWSKDAIIGAVHDTSHALEASLYPGQAVEHHGDGHAETGPRTYAWSKLPVERQWVLWRVYQVSYWASVIAAFMTAFYTFRALFLTFFGPLKVPEEAGHHAHESPPVMTTPLWILGVFALAIGFLVGGPFEFTHGIANFLQLAPSLAYAPVRATGPATEFHVSVAAQSTFFALLGIGLAAFFYLGKQTEIARITDLPGVRLLYDASYGKLFIDQIYAVLFVWPLRALAALSYWIDRLLIDGLVNLIGKLPPLLGSALRLLQPGLVQYYALAMVLGTIVLVATLLRWPLG